MTDNAIVTACISSIAAMVVALIQSSDRGEDPTSVALVILGVLGEFAHAPVILTVMNGEVVVDQQVVCGRLGFGG